MADPGNKKTDVIGKKIRDILADQSKINGIVDIIEELSSKDSAVVLECIDGSCKIFSELIQSGAFPITKVSKIAKKKSKIPEKPELIFEARLRHNYALTLNKLLALLRHSSPKIMEKVVETLMIFVKAENRKLQQRSTVLIFSNDLFLRIVKQLTNGLHSNTLAAKLLKPYYQYNDISYYMLRNVGKIVSKFLDEMPTKCGPHFAENVYHLLQSIVIPECQDDVPGNLFAISTETMEGNESSGNHTIMNLNSYKKAFTSAWMSFLSLQLDKNLYRRVMVMLDERVVPYLVDPKILMDFLMDSYDIGGMISILALNSLFVLIHKYNLDYPNFYQKLYCLFNEEIFHLKYCARFFYLADLFLMSTHLPAYLVAAFIKRLSRLALSAPPHGVALIVTFVSNLLKRHPNCNVLIHRKMRKQEKNDGDVNEQSQKVADPFKEDESDLCKCEALQSSLWELETLRLHYYPEIQSLVGLLEKPICKTERDVSEWFESSYETLFDDECTEFTKGNAFIEYHIPKGLMSDTLNELWCVHK